MTIHCENKLCIYWDDDHCLCSSVELDNLGMCADCICFVQRGGAHSEKKAAPAKTGQGIQRLLITHTVRIRPVFNGSFLFFHHQFSVSQLKGGGWIQDVIAAVREPREAPNSRKRGNPAKIP